MRRTSIRFIEPRFSATRGYLIETILYHREFQDDSRNVMDDQSEDRGA